MATGARHVGMVLLIVTLTGCGTSAATGPTPSHTGRPPQGAITTRSLPGVGAYLVNSKGFALYMFVPDQQRAVTCTGPCAGSWPPALLALDEQPTAGRGVDASRLSSVPDPEGGRVVTYNKWPLYTYVGDVTPDQITGQALDLDGGYWYLIRPSGDLVTTPIT